MIGIKLFSIYIIQIVSKYNKIYRIKKRFKGFKDFFQHMLYPGFIHIKGLYTYSRSESIYFRDILDGTYCLKCAQYIIYWPF